MLSFNTAFGFFLVSLALSLGYFVARAFYALGKVLFWALCESLDPTRQRH